jgi:hypothetical protein
LERQIKILDFALPIHRPCSEQVLDSSETDPQKSKPSEPKAISLRLEAVCELALVRQTVGKTSNVWPRTKEVIELYVRVPSPLQAYPFAPEVELT